MFVGLHRLRLVTSSSVTSMRLQAKSSAAVKKRSAKKTRQAKVTLFLNVFVAHFVAIHSAGV